MNPQRRALLAGSLGIAAAARLRAEDPPATAAADDPGAPAWPPAERIALWPGAAPGMPARAPVPALTMNGPRGVLNVRFQPYRLTNSRCYNVADARIRCTACHDPHGPLDTGALAYDHKCTACHGAAACPAGKQSCVICHMPKIELPGAHARFTDHQIRIVRAGDPYPN